MATGWRFVGLAALCALCTAHNRTQLTRELIPLAAPTNLTLGGLEGRDALISWAPVAPESVRGTFRGYIVRVWNHALSQVYATPPQVTQTAVQFFAASRNFLTVSVRNDKYIGPRSAALWFDAPEAEPGMPLRFQYSQLGAHSALLQWSRPTHANGALLGYNIYCSEQPEAGPSAQAFVQGRDHTQAKVTGLKLGQRYLIEVAAVNCAGAGERNSLLVEAEPHQPAPPSRPTFNYTIGFEALDQESHCADAGHGALLSQDGCLVRTRITWTPDVTHNPGEHFFLKYRLKGDGGDWTETLPELSEDFVILRDFDACRSYEIVLVAVDGPFRTESEPQETPAVLFPH